MGIGAMRVQRTLAAWCGIALLATAGCGESGSDKSAGGKFLPYATVASPEGGLTYNMVVARSRDYRLYVPKGYVKGKALPLVVMLHGCKQDPDSFAAGTRMNQLADEAGFLVLYPRQSKLANGYSCWNWFDPRTQKRGGEAAIVAAMVRDVMQKHSVDPERIYAAGISAGGSLAAILGSCYSDLFAAVAVHSGFPYGAADTPMAAMSAMEKPYPYDADRAGRAAFECRGGGRRNIPMLVVHGSDDKLVLPKAAGDVIKQFAQVEDFCDDGADNESFAAARPAAQSVQAQPGQHAYEAATYLRDSKAVLKEVMVTGLGHAWSGGDDGRRKPDDKATIPYNDPAGPDASRMIWEFFRQHTLSGNAVCALP